MAAMESTQARAAVLKNASIGISLGIGKNFASTCSPMANATPRPKYADQPLWPVPTHCRPETAGLIMRGGDKNKPSVNQV